MDSFGSHKTSDVISVIKSECKSDIILIPPKTTSFLQPLDVSINHPFKVALRNEWNNWLENTPAEYTKSGLYKKNCYYVPSNYKKF